MTLASNRAPSASAGLPRRLPVILDTDIGDDIDDTWALAMLLRCPRLDLRLVTTTHGKAEYRARLAARLLSTAGRSGVPVGLGAGGLDGSGKQAAWVESYDLARHGGPVHRDGVQALIDTIMASPEPVTLIAIGPSETVAAALAREPAIAGRARFVGMQGAVFRGYQGGPVCPEWNVRADVAAARVALLAPWREAVITPLDTCGLVRLRGARLECLKRAEDALVQAVLENWRLWSGQAALAELTETSVLFDTVAVYLAGPGETPLLERVPLRLGILDDGTTAVDPGGALFSVATAWRDLEAFEDLLVETLLR